MSLQAAGLGDGDRLTAIAQQANIAATDSACALFCCGGDRIVTWGRASVGGDSSAVQGLLIGVQQIQGTGCLNGGAFAAILADGSVVTWGHADWGGDSSGVQGKLIGVKQIQATRCLNVVHLLQSWQTDQW